MTAARIAKGCKFPPRFLYRILRRLVDAGIMTGVSGPGGGYALARSPRKITLWEVIQAVEGPTATHELVAVHPRQRKAMELINRLAERHERQLEKSLRSVTLAKLIDA